MSKYQETVTRIDFLVPLSAKKITVKLDSPRHYLVVAKQSYEQGRMRDSLSYLISHKVQQAHLVSLRG
jgi:hypothetical protein